MTSTAANVLFGYWSHDLGGYNIYCPANDTTITPCKCGTVVQPCNITTGKCGKAPSELYTRWLQFGVFSPIFRPHCSHCDRRIWAYPELDFARMRTAMLFRHILRPYLYTAGRIAFDTAVMLVHPLYYDWPSDEDAYLHASTQYLFGDAFMVAPVTDAINSTASGRNVWVPPGKWLYFNASRTFEGPVNLTGLHFNLDEYPLFVRAGSAIPTYSSTLKADYVNAPVVWIVYLDTAGGKGLLYEDDGRSLAYRESQSYGWTSLTHAFINASISVSISPMQGSFDGAPRTRRHVVQLRSLKPLSSVLRIACNEELISFTEPPQSDLMELYNFTSWWIVPPFSDNARPWLRSGSLVIVGPMLDISSSLKIVIDLASSAAQL